MTSLASLILGSGIALILLGTGRTLVALFRLEGLPPAGRFAFSLGIGAGLYNYLFLALGVLGWMDPRLYGSIFAAGFLLALPGLAQTRRDFREPEQVDYAGAEDDGLPPKFRQFLLGVLSLCLLMALISSLAPVSDWDSRTYHLVSPAAYLREGKMFFQPDYVLGNVYLAQSALNLWILAIGPDSATAVLAFWFAFGLLCAVYAIGISVFSASTGLIAMTLIATFGMFVQRAIAPLPDFAATMMSMLVVLLTTSVRKTPTVSRAVAIGLVAGLSVIFRLNSAIFLFQAALLILIWWRWFCGASWGRILALGLVGSIACVAAIAPWAIRSYVWTGNPVYPFLPQYFDSWAWNEASSRMSKHLLSATSPQSKVVTNLLSVFAFLGFGGLILGLMPWGLLFKRRRVECGIFLGLFVLALVTQGSWKDERYVFAAVCLATLVASYALSRALEWSGGYRRAFVALVTLVILTDVAAGAVFYQQFMRATLGFTSRDSFLRNTTGLYDDFLWMNDNLPETAHVLVFDKQAYYLQRKYTRFLCKTSPRVGIFDFAAYSDGGDFARSLQSAGITHIMVPGPGHYMTNCFWDPEAVGAKTVRLFAELREQHAEMIHYNPVSEYHGRLFFSATAPPFQSWVYRLNLAKSDKGAELSDKRP